MRMAATRRSTSLTHRSKGRRDDSNPSDACEEETRKGKGEEKRSKRESFRKIRGEKGKGKERKEESRSARWSGDGKRGRKGDEDGRMEWRSLVSFPRLTGDHGFDRRLRASCFDRWQRAVSVAWRWLRESRNDDPPPIVDHAARYQAVQDRRVTICFSSRQVGEGESAPTPRIFLLRDPTLTRFCRRSSTDAVFLRFRYFLPDFIKLTFE